MSDRGILPKFLGLRNRHHTPTYGILLSAIGVLYLAEMSFAEVVELLNLLYCFGQIIEFAAFVELRRSRADLERPFRIPVNTLGAALLCFPPLVFILIIISYSTIYTLLKCVLVSIAGGGLYFVLQVAKNKGWVHFEDKYQDGRSATEGLSGTSHAGSDRAMWESSVDENTALYDRKNSSFAAESEEEDSKL